MILPRVSLLLLTALGCGAHLFGQAAPAPTATTPSGTARDEIVELSPFMVSTTEDRGYQAQSSLGGSRLKANLKDVASPTSAFTAQFLEDIAATSIDDLAPFMLSTEFDNSEDAGNQNRLNATSRPLRVRGINGSGSTSINFFKSSFRIDSFNTERIDQSRGPNSVLFGLGDPGGIINVTTKRAVLSQQKGSLALVGKSHDGFRQELDFNQPILKDRLAVRVGVASERLNAWRNYEHDDEDRLFGTIKFRITPKTELNVDLEQAEIDKSVHRTFTGYDGYTLWRDAGRTIDANANAPRGIARVAGNNVAWLVYFSDTNRLINMRNTTSSVSRTSNDGDMLAMTDFSIMPRETAIYGPGFYQELGYSRLSAYLTHSFTRDLNVEIAGMRTDAHTDNSDPQLAGGQALKVDTQPTLLFNNTPNPNAGRTYFEGLPQRNLNNTRDDAVRAMAAYRKDLGRWGKHTLAGVYQYAFSKTSQAVIREQIISANAPNLAMPEQNNNRVFRRTYVDITGPSTGIVMADPRKGNPSGLTDPVLNATYVTDWIPFNQNTQLNSNEGTTIIGMFQSSFWKDRIQTIIGGSRDQRSDYLGTQVRTPLPGFQQGILTPVRSKDPNDVDARSISFSGVFHATNWLSLTYSKAQNSGLPSFSGRLNAPTGGFIRPPIPHGKTQDMGIKLDLFDHRLFLTAQYFKTKAESDFDFTAVMTGNVNPIWNALEAAGVLRASGLVLANVSAIETGASFDSQTDGYEIELTANPSERWRLFANYSSTSTMRTNIGREEQAYLANFRDLWLRNGSVPLTDGTGRTVAQAVAGVDQAAFTNFVLADEKRPLGQVKHKFNLRTTYELSAERLKGFSIGGGARYFSEPIIGFTATGALGGPITRTTFYGSKQVFFDANVGYRRKLPQVFGRSFTWALQLNINNVLENDSFVRVRQASDGQLVTYRWNPPREWILTSRFSF
jgi:iron complex outermembrane receptor protein